MSFSNGPKGIVTDGLVFAVDAGNAQSFTSGSTDAYDLMNPSITGSLVNSAQYSPVGGGSWATDGTDAFLKFGEQSFLESQTNLTISCWHQANATANMTLWGASVTSGGYLVDLMNYTGTRIYMEYNNGGTQYDTQVGLPTGIEVNKWADITFVYDASGGSDADRVKMYVNGNYVAWNGAQVGSNFVSTAATLGPFYLGTDGHYSGYDWQGYIGPTMVYNRSLTASEVTQNYNSQKQRFGYGI